jgi:hypothetical protein
MHRPVSDGKLLGNGACCDWYLWTLRRQNRTRGIAFGLWPAPVAFARQQIGVGIPGMFADATNGKKPQRLNKPFIS